MARERQVTRTIKATKVNVLCLNVETAEPFNKDVLVSGVFTDAKKLQKAVEKMINNDTEKAVHVVDIEEINTIYAMTEQDFIKYATPLDERVSNLSKATDTE